MKKDSRYSWYILDVIVFLAINLFILRFIGPEQILILSDTGWFQIIILALAMYRITDVITHENVTEVFRAPFMDRKMVDGKETWENSTKGFRGFASGLVSCNACMGVWVSMILFYFYLFFPWSTMAFAFVMTLACLERFLSKIYNFLEKRG